LLDALSPRIAIAYAALMVVCVGALSFYLLLIGRDSYLNTIRADAESQARLVAVGVRPYLAGEGLQGELSGLVAEMGRQTEVRVTIIDPSGAVLADSERDAQGMENHSQRPEVQAALRGSTGEDRRMSGTLGYDSLYVAVPVVEGAKVIAVARVSQPLSRIDQAIVEVRRAVLLGGLVATGLAVALALVIARSVTGPIKGLTAVASRMAEGELDQRVGDYSRDEVGQLARAFDTMADRLKANIKDVSAERNTLSTILSTMADGLLIVDGRGIVVMANRAAGILLQASTSGMAGRSYAEVLRDHELIPVVRGCLEEGSQKSGTAWVGSTRRFLRLVATPLGSRQEGALALIQDLSEVRRVETVRRDFIANVSHELRTPLASLKAIVETLEEGAVEEPEAARDFLSKMHSEVDGMAHLVGELLELSRIESGQVALHLEPVSAVEIAERAAARLRPQADRAGLSLSLQLPPDLSDVRADEERIERVLVNLVHNAIKFTPYGGEITLGARQGEEEVVVWVADTGVGINPADLNRIFERFYKADRARSGGGTGLGLAIAKHVVQAHGGRIWADSTEGAGSTFYLSLPVAEAG
jgi:two-component system, OmpR family, phosphate regulon sensor histidine kinase PhoR